MKNKFKKSIVILSIFFLSFATITDFNQKETQAVIVVDDIVYILLGLTVLGTGVVAANNAQVKDMGNRVWSEMKNLYNTSEELDKQMREMYPEAYPDYSNLKDLPMKITDGLKKAVTNVAENLPIENVQLILDSIYNSGESYFLAPSVPYNSFNFSIDIVAKKGSFKRDSKIFGYGADESVALGSSYSVDYLTDGAIITDDLKLSIYTKIVDGYVEIYSNYNGNEKLISRVSKSSTYNYYYVIKNCTFDITEKKVVDIPYGNTKIKENYNPTVINQRLDTLIPDRSITISPDAVVQSGILDGTITEDAVLTWDQIKDLYITKDKDGVIINPDDTTTSTIDKVVNNIFSPTITKSLDFSPLYLSFSDKFPFSIPFDIYNLISDFKAEKKAPKFYIDLSPFSMTGSKSSAGFELDFTKFSVLFGIARTFILISFIVFLAIKTRDIIKG